MDQKYLIDTLVNNGIALQNAVNQYAKNAQDAHSAVAHLNGLILNLCREFVALNAEIAVLKTHFPIKVVIERTVPERLSPIKKKATKKKATKKKARGR